MYQAPNINRRRNPRDGATYLSLFTFAFAADIFRTSSRRGLKEDDIYQITKGESSAALGDRAEALWRKHRSLNKVVLGLLWKRYLLYGLLYLGGNIGAMIVTPTAMEALISYFNPQSQLTPLEGCINGLSVLAILVATGCALILYQYALEVMGVRVRVALTSLIYRKSLALAEHAVLELGNGRIVTMMTKDLNIFETVLQYTHEASIGCAMLAAMVVMLYIHMDAAALLGAGLLVAMLPVQVVVSLLIKRLRLKAAGRTDLRLRRIQEILASIKLIKLYNWESYFRRVAKGLRRKEVFTLEWIYRLRAVISGLSVLTWRIALFLSILLYSWGNYLTPEKAYLATTCYGLIRRFYDKNLSEAMLQLPEARSSLSRIEKFLQLPEWVPPSKPHLLWTAPTLTCITGPTAGGKSHFLKSILNSNSSYASQEPWLFPTTIRQNILFGQHYCPKRYRKVLHVCALNQDLEKLPKGDQTILTNRGLNLSRGQQCRVNLARAVYKEADVYLLDDVLSSLDAKVANFIFEECIQGYLGGKLRLVVCPNRHFLGRSDEIVRIENGYVVTGSGDKSLTQNELTSDIPEQVCFDISTAKEEESSNCLDNGVVLDAIESVAGQVNSQQKVLAAKDEVIGTTEKFNEERPYFESMKEGSVGLKVYKQYFAYAGGWLVGIVVVLALANEYIAITYDYYLTVWLEVEQTVASAKFNESSNPGNTSLATIYDQTVESRNKTLLIYIVFMCQSFWHILWYYLGYKLALSASRRIHEDVVDKVVSATMGFFDGQQSGNILNRFAKDFAIVDDRLPLAFMSSLDCFFLALFILVYIGEAWPLFLVPSFVMIGALLVCSRLYLRTSRDLRRLEASTRAPIVGFLVSTLEGLCTIRAAGNEALLRQQFDEHQDLNTSAMLMYVASKRAFAYWTNILQNCFSGIVIFAFVFYHRDMFAGDVGFILQQALSLDVIVYGLQIWTDVENCMVSTERVLDYLNAEQEAATTDSPKLLEQNKEAGSIFFKNVSLQYPSCGGLQLNQVDLAVLPGEKVGVVGRTGSGKSSLVSALFRLYNFDGTICIDGIDISQLSLHQLRSNISVIPQAPVLFEGTIRNNLDPLQAYPDADLLEALSKVGLGIADLNCEASSLGLSAGQVQQLCLARCTLRKNKVLILDEATANVDVEAEKVILAIVHSLFRDATVLTIAHNLEIIMESDRVVVVDGGRIIEVGEPDVLLRKKDGAFYELVKNSGLVN